MQPTPFQPDSAMTSAGARNTHRLVLRAALQARVAYGFLILALCLMIADFCRLMPSLDSSTEFSAPSAHVPRHSRNPRPSD
jgi:hypothetical protein